MLPHDTTHLPCVLFTGGRGATGYGITHETGKSRTTHRVAWEQASGQTLPKGTGQIAHTCDVRLCIQNDGVSFYPLGHLLMVAYGHLFLTTNAGNALDMRTKGRARSSTGPKNPGELNGQAKLTDAQVLELRARYRPQPRFGHGRRTGPTQRELAREYGVSQQVICKAINGETWKHV